MSLINDLLIEVDRRGEEEGRADSSPLERLAPNHGVNDSPVSVARLLRNTLGTVAFLAASVFLFWPMNDDDTTLRAISQVGPASDAPPAVSAKATLSTPSTEADSLQDWAASVLANPPLDSSASLPGAEAPAPGQVDVLFQRPIRLQNLRVEQHGRTTRLRIVADRAGAYRIESGAQANELEIVLDGVVLRDPLSTLDLVGTPIRSIQTRHKEDALRLSLVLDSGMRVQSQWIDQPRSSALVIDLQPDVGAFVASTASSSAPHPRPAADDRVSRRPSDSVFAEAVVPKDEARSASSAAFPARAGNESDVHIARSANDRLRVDRRAALKRARAAVEAARASRSDGDRDDALLHYASAVQALPGYRDAILEWASLLGELDRQDEAIKILRSARRGSPRDAGFTMLQARLTSDSDLAGAVELLDASGHSLTEAPEVVALAAAYLQRAGQHGRAIERYETLLRRYPSRSSWWMGLGISLEAEGRDSEAIDVYRIAMQIGELPGRTRHWVSARIAALGTEG